MNAEGMIWRQVGGFLKLLSSATQYNLPPDSISRFSPQVSRTSIPLILPICFRPLVDLNVVVTLRLSSIGYQPIAVYFDKYEAAEYTWEEVREFSLGVALWMHGGNRNVGYLVHQRRSNDSITGTQGNSSEA